MVKLEGLTERWKQRIKENGGLLTAEQLTGGMCSGESEEYAALVDARLYFGGAGHPKRHEYQQRYGVSPEDVVRAFEATET